MPMLQTLRAQSRLVALRQPLIMGILNLTPDSFFDGGRWQEREAALRQTEQMLAAGADVLDLGAVSTRPGAAEVSESEELARILPTLEAIVARFPEALISIDTFRASVAEACLERGAHWINDVSAGSDPAMWSVVARYRAAYVLMHMQGTPQTMQLNPQYDDLIPNVLDFFSAKIEAVRAAGVRDVILDLGFGFGKTLDHNYALLRQLSDFRMFGLPILVGVSRKSMIWKALGSSPDAVLSATSALHLFALQRGADILRVHDVREAVEVRQLSARLVGRESF